jgi:GTP-binding protein Era
MTEQDLLAELQPLPPDHRSGFVALIGKPNVGKSTLLNAWLGTRLAAVSPRPQTTRNRLLGILTRDDAQVIFVDTPGIHRPRTKLGDYMVDVAQKAIPDADVILFVVDSEFKPTEADRHVADMLAEVQTAPVLLAMNKIDLVPPQQLAERVADCEALGRFAGSVAISALHGNGMPALLGHIIDLLPVGPRFYPADQISDLQERFIASELIREQVMRAMRQEIPHATAVVVQDFAERSNRTLYISAHIFVEKDTQKGIIIGREGQQLKRIGQAARIALQDFFHQKVYVELWVKVRKDWRRKDALLKQFGYDRKQAGH